MPDGLATSFRADRVSLRHFPVLASACKPWAADIAAWLSNKKITALWMNESARNTWIMVDGVGWKKLSNANDSAWLSMVMLGSHAEQTNATVNVRVEADNMVHSLYVW